MAQPFQLSPRRRTVVARLSQSHQRGALEGGVATRTQYLVRSSHALRDLAEPASATGRLAGQRLDVRTVGAPGPRVGCPRIAAELSLRGRRSDLRGIRKHGGFR